MSFPAVSQGPYYLSSSAGDDANAGTIDAPFKSLEKITGISLVPGDTVYFKKGDLFKGHFEVNGSGSQNFPIVITSYGSGNKPIISGQVGKEGGGDYLEAILVENNDNIVFDGLEIQNERQITRAGVDSSKSFGIHVSQTTRGTLENFIFRNLTIRNIYAIKTVDPSNQQEFNAFIPSGIRIKCAWNYPGKVGNIKGVLVEDCLFANLQRLGVKIAGPGANNGVGNDTLNRIGDVIVRNNEFQHLGGTCVLPTRTYNCLIENNMFYHPGSTLDPRMAGRGSSVWTWRCINTVIQRNKCLHIRGILDSHGIHIDHENINTFVQYNYMEDCEGGFVEILGGNLNAVYRYNISVNDGWRNNPGWKNSNHTLWISDNVPDGIHRSDSNYIYNNTVFIDSAFNTAIDMEGNNIYLFNNIFYAANGNIGSKQVSIKSNNYFMSNNLFNGNIDNRFSNKDSKAIKGNPDFYHQGANNDLGYQLNAGSPAVNSGVIHKEPKIYGAGTGVFENVPPYPTVDYFGNTLDTDSINTGACNAKAGEVIEIKSVAVTNVISSITNTELYTGNEIQVHAFIIPADASDKSVTWTSLNPSIASVSNGLLTALKPGSAKIVVVTNDGGFTDVIIVTVLQTTNLQQNDIFANRLYPNPVQDGILHIILNKNLQKLIIEIYTSQGQLFKSEELTDVKKVNFSVADLNPGMYYLKIKDGLISETYKFMVE